MQETKITELLIIELNEINRLYGLSFASPHEAYDAVLEELDLLFEEIRQKRSDNNMMREEAIQIGVTAMKLIMSQEEWARVEVSCRKCRHNVITIGEYIEFGGDPCETCDDLCNWQPKKGEQMNEFMEILEPMAELLKRKKY